MDYLGRIRRRSPNQERHRRNAFKEMTEGTIALQAEKQPQFREPSSIMSK